MWCAWRVPKGPGAICAICARTDIMALMVTSVHDATAMVRCGTGFLGSVSGERNDQLAFVFFCEVPKYDFDMFVCPYVILT